MLFWPGCCCPPTEPSPCSQICITVTDETETAVEGADVIMDGAVVATTDASGVACFAIAGAGSYSGGVAMAGRPSAAWSVTVGESEADCAGDGKLHVAVELPPAYTGCRMSYTVHGCGCELTGAVGTLTRGGHTHFSVSGVGDLTFGNLNFYLPAGQCSGTVTNVTVSRPEFATYSGVPVGGDIEIFRPDPFNQFCFPKDNPHATCDAPAALVFTFVGLWPFSGPFTLPRVDPGADYSPNWQDICRTVDGSGVQCSYTTGFIGPGCAEPQSIASVVYRPTGCAGAAHSLGLLLRDHSYGTFACPINTKFYVSGEPESYIIVTEA